MPKTRASSKSNMQGGSDSDHDDLNVTIAAASVNASDETTIEERLAGMMRQIQSLQAEVARSNQLLQENERERRAASASIASASGADIHSGISLTTVLSQLNQTLSSSKPEHMKRLYDLPEFDGRPEDWPMFKESFEMTTEEHRYNERQNMLRLQKALKGKARETVECLLIHSSNVPRIIETLRDRFGRPEQLVKSQIARLRNVPPISDNRIEQIIPFATKVQNLASFLEAAGCEHHLCNPTLMEELELKISVQRRLEWASYAVTIKPRPTIRHFSDWLQELSRLINAVSLNSNEQIKGGTSSKFFYADEASGAIQNGGCKMCPGQHKIVRCNHFLDMNPRQRWRVVRQKKLCFNCLDDGHRSSSCEQRHECSIKNCTLKLHKLLHEQQEKPASYLVGPQTRGQQAVNNTWQSKQQGALTQGQRAKQPVPNQRLSNQEGMLQQVHRGQQPADHQGQGGQQGAHQRTQCGQNGWNHEGQQDQHVFTSSVLSPSKSRLYFKILPVKLYSSGKEVSCYAFLDEGSSISLMNDGLAERLGIRGVKENLTLQWFGNKTVTESSRRVNLEISGVWESCGRFELNNVRTVKDLKLPTQTLEMSELDAKFRHIKKLPIETYSSAVPELLIGLDNAYLGVARKVAADGQKGPAVIQTKLGWVVYGPTDRCDANNINRALFVQISQEDELEALVKNYIADDSLGVRAVVEPVEPQDTIRAKKILEETTIRRGNRFETGLLWKHDDVVFPESRNMAMRRLLGLEKKFQRDENFYKEYSRLIKDYEMKGFSRKLSGSEASTEGRRNWYLPHFGIYNPNKPGKLRLVFDAAAEVRGTSLNSVLLTGPDLGQPLTTILMKFRQKAVAVCADIVQMFHQVLIRPEDQLSQRFLWRDSPENPIEEYVMTVMTFGATCSPCSAQYVKNQNALEFETKFPDAARAIVKNHYVDDFVHCFSDEQEAVRISKEVTWIHAQGGFELNRFVSNSKMVNQCLNNSEGEPLTLSLDRDDATCFQKVLGMHWDTKQDNLKFLLSFGRVDPTLLKGDVRPTKRNVLSITMSIFDPFGIASEYSLVAKLLLQLIWRTGVGWDERITEEANEVWKKWLLMLRDVEQLSIPRCYNNLFSTTSLELHVFADASELAYAAVAYWRIREETAHKGELAFVIGKTKCSPLKLTSIPRLELQSAVMATRLRQMIVKSHDAKPTRVVMWSDSKTVLSWIKSDHRRYKPYVAHRINEILESSSVEDWRWVPSAQNPADFGTCMLDGKRDSFWLSGPRFLRNDESTWPESEACVTTREELRTKLTLLHINTNCDIFDRFSDFTRLKRVVAWISRFRNNCLTKTKSVVGPLSVMELEQAEFMICRAAQMDAYFDEYHTLSLNKQVERSSSLHRLTPFIDKAGVIRLNGRINNAVAISAYTRQPVILPKDHRVTELIVEFYHRTWKHQNEQTVIAEIRRRFWIPHIRVIVRRVARACQLCKNKNLRPAIPLMGQLPEDRLTPFVRPFSYVGLDYMGPFLITSGRRTEKRWIALFTCLTTRAIHLEIARDLSTDMCLMCIRNFMNRRGRPVRIRSDNGTNFVGAERELKKQAREIESGRIADALASINVEWIFNCPLNPHAGGCWERLVRSVKAAMEHTLKASNLQEHSLYSLMCEAENIVNSRPLTHIPIEAPTDEPLTPNHFLLGTANSDQTPHPHEEKLQATRKQWRMVQQMQHSFWRKWLAEYLPDLCRRTKWYSPVTPLKVDDIVMICDSSVQRSNWMMGRVVTVLPGKDSQVRAAEIQTKTGILKRPACMLARLDVGES